MLIERDMERRVFTRNAPTRLAIPGFIIALLLIAAVPANLENPTVGSLYVLIAIALLWGIIPIVTKNLWPIAVTDAGIETRGFWGQANFISWEDIVECREFNRLLYFDSNSQPRRWFTTTLQLHDLEGYVAALLELSPPSNPAHQWALAHRKKLDQKR